MTRSLKSSIVLLYLAQAAVYALIGLLVPEDQNGAALLHYLLALIVLAIAAVHSGKQVAS